MRINILSSRFPFPLEKGDKLRLYHQIKLLAQNHELHLFAMTDGKTSQTDIDQLKPFCKSITSYVIPSWRRYLNILDGVFKSLPAHVSYFYDSSVHRRLLEDMHATKADLNFIQLVRVLPYTTGLQGHIWMDLMDAFSANLLRRQQASPWPMKSLLGWEAKKMALIERKALTRCPTKTIISEQDRLNIDPENKYSISVVPNGVDTDYFVPNPAFIKTHDLCFAGNLGYEPNITAIHFLGQKVLPQLPTTVHTKIGGARPHASLFNYSHANIEVTGWVDDIRDIYYAGKIFVAPLFTGSGQQNKILEAMACGIPVIATSLVNNAIQATPNKEIMLADTPEAFVHGIQSLLSDEQLRNDLAHAGRAFVVRRYKWSQITASLESIIVSTQ